MIVCKLGNTDLTVSRLGLGTMRLPVGKHNPDLSEAIGIMNYAIKQGISFFDIGTFYCHFQSEKIFGSVLLTNPGKKLNIAAKNNTHQLNSPDWIGQLNNTLKIYGCDSLDLYFLHYLDYETWINYFKNGCIYDQIREARRLNLFKYLGFSSHDTPENIIRLIDAKVFSSVILSYNLLNRDYENVIKYANEQGMGVIIMNPLAGGLLARQQINVDSLFHEIPGYSLTEIALNYVYSNPNVHCVLSGMQNKNEIDENVAVLLRKPLFISSQLEKINGLIEAEKNKQLFYCTKCNYCLPCTQGIDIPSVITLMNKYFVDTDYPFFMRDYSVLAQPASCCIECGRCESRCPNKLSISKIMSKAAITFID
jgi:uncharacterized protein